jgi:hypothetical protein
MPGLQTRRSHRERLMPKIPASAAVRRPRRRGHTLGAATFGLVVGAITLILSTQIVRVTLLPSSSEAALDCPKSVQSLWTALQRARRSAAGVPGEQPALSTFRAQLEPEWLQLASIQKQCQQRAEWASAVGALTQLRFEEEQAVRNEARGIAAQRQLAEQLVNALVRSDAP